MASFWEEKLKNFQNCSTISFFFAQMSKNLVKNANDSHFSLIFEGKVSLYSGSTTGINTTQCSFCTKQNRKAKIKKKKTSLNSTPKIYRQSKIALFFMKKIKININLQGIKVIVQIRYQCRCTRMSLVLIPLFV